MKQLLSFALALVPLVARAQDVSPIQKMFESGQYKEVITAAPKDAPPPVLYLVGQSHEKMRDKDPAREMYTRLSMLPESDPWHFVGMSAKQFLDSDIGNEREWVAAHNLAARYAESAIKMAPDFMEAHYQLGLIFFDMSTWSDAAEEFDRAAQLNPSFAYAHYYAGRAHRSAQRPEQMTAHFEAFLKLAPQAPERSQVLQLMKN